MLLAVDVGNTNFTCGIFDGEELVTTFRITTKEKRTSDEYGFLFCGIVENRGIKHSIPMMPNRLPPTLTATSTHKDGSPTEPPTTCG